MKRKLKVKKGGKETLPKSEDKVEEESEKISLYYIYKHMYIYVCIHTYEKKKRRTQRPMIKKSLPQSTAAFSGSRVF